MREYLTPEWAYEAHFQTPSAEKTSQVLFY